MSVLHLEQLENIISDTQLEDLRNFMINCKWNNKCLVVLYKLSTTFGNIW